MVNKCLFSKPTCYPSFIYSSVNNNKLISQSIIAFLHAPLLICQKLLYAYLDFKSSADNFIFVMAVSSVNQIIILQLFLTRRTMNKVLFQSIIATLHAPLLIICQKLLYAYLNCKSTTDNFIFVMALVSLNILVILQSILIRKTMNKVLSKLTIVSILFVETFSQIARNFYICAFFQVKNFVSFLFFAKTLQIAIMFMQKV